eukprot:364248-Chlamydomonas_euryale.AAC.6
MHVHDLGSQLAVAPQGNASIGVYFAARHVHDLGTQLAVAPQGNASIGVHFAARHVHDLGSQLADRRGEVSVALVIAAVALLTPQLHHQDCVACVCAWSHGACMHAR